MSSKNSEYSEISTRLLEVADHFKKHKGVNNSELLKSAEVGHSFFSNIRNGKIDNPNSEMIRKIVKSTGINGHWVLTGEGKMFEVRENITLAAEDDKIEQSLADQDSVPYSLINQAFALLSRIEQKVSDASTDPLPGDVELVLSRLLNTSLERRHKDQNSHG